MLKLWPDLSWFRGYKCQHGTLTGFVVHNQLETISEQRLYHQAILVLGGIPLSACFNIEPLSGDASPCGEPGHPIQSLRIRDLVSEDNVVNQRIVRCGEKASCRNERLGPH